MDVTQAIGRRLIYMRRVIAVLMPMLALSCAGTTAPAEPGAGWTIVLHAADFVIGAGLKELHTRRTWVDEFDYQSGAFDVALRKTAIAISAPRCRMDYLVLNIPFYYPENPKQASVGDRRRVYDALVALKTNGSGSITARVEAPGVLARTGPRGVELAACNLYFALPLSVRDSAQ